MLEVETFGLAAAPGIREFILQEVERMRSALQRFVEEAEAVSSDGDTIQIITQYDNVSVTRRMLQATTAVIVSVRW